MQNTVTTGQYASLWTRYKTVSEEVAEIYRTTALHRSKGKCAGMATKKPPTCLRYR
jgi:hypothetical protein